MNKEKIIIGQHWEARNLGRNDYGMHTITIRAKNPIDQIVIIAHVFDGDEQKAIVKANLIAAAPDMYECLKNIDLCGIYDKDDGSVFVRMTIDEHNAIKTVLNKSLGI